MGDIYLLEKFVNERQYSQTHINNLCPDTSTYHAYHAPTQQLDEYVFKLVHSYKNGSVIHKFTAVHLFTALYLHQLMRNIRI